MPRKTINTNAPRLSGEVIIATPYSVNTRSRGFTMGGTVRVSQSKGWRDIPLKADVKLVRGDLIEFDEIGSAARNVVKIGRRTR